MPTLSPWEQMILEEQALQEGLDPQLAQDAEALQTQGAMLPEEAMLAEELQALEAEMSRPSSESRVPEAEANAALSQAKQTQLAQRIGNEDELTTLINKYKKSPVEMDYTGLLALADAWGDGKSNLAQAYQRPMTREQRNLKVIELQDMLQRRREEAAKGQREQLKLALMSRQKGQTDPLKEEERRARIAMYKAAATGRAQNLDEVKDSQALVAGYGKRMLQSEDVFNSLEKQGFNRASIPAGIKASLPGFAQPGFTKQQEQAERNFINAQLRRESGAAISQSEYDSAEKQYFPRPGDTQEVLEQKRANRMQAIEAMKVSAGRAWDRVPLVQPRSANPAMNQKLQRLQELRKKAGGQ